MALLRCQHAITIIYPLKLVIKEAVRLWDYEPVFVVVTFKYIPINGSKQMFLHSHIKCNESSKIYETLLHSHTMPWSIFRCFLLSNHKSLTFSWVKKKKNKSEKLQVKLKFFDSLNTRRIPTGCRKMKTFQQTLDVRKLKKRF